MLPLARNASLDQSCFVKTYNLLLINHYGIASLTHVLTIPLSPNGRQSSSIWFSRDAYLELALLNLYDDHHLMSSSHGLYVISLLMHTHGTIPNPHRQHKHTYVMDYFTKHNWQLLPYHKIDWSHMTHSLCFNMLTNLESNLWSLSCSTLYLPILYHNILRYIKNFSFECMLALGIIHS
jgi:hypothetical protein